VDNAVSDPWISQDEREPFRSDELKFTLWLTPQEWQLCYGLSFSLQLAEWMEMSLSLGQSFRWIIGQLQREDGYSWTGIHMDQDNDLWAKTDTAISAPNKLWLFQLSQNSMPDYSIHIPAAASFLREHLPDCPNFDHYMECLHMAENKVAEDLARVKKVTEDAVTPEMLTEMKRIARDRQVAIQQAQQLEDDHFVN
jgi:hypothetical protein